MKRSKILSGLFIINFVLCFFLANVSAVEITACLQNNTGQLYNVNIGLSPSGNCHNKDTEITWNVEGSPGADGAPGADGTGIEIFDTRNTAGGDGTFSAATVGSGQDDTAFGFQALKPNTGSGNTAVGSRALQTNNTGNDNTAVGFRALRDNTTSGGHVAIGSAALENTFGIGDGSTAIGSGALRFVTSGSFHNTALGNEAGKNLGDGSNNLYLDSLGPTAFGGTENLTIRIGNSQTRAFIEGIRGTTTVQGDAIAVLIDSDGQLGTASSSARYKEDIRDLGEVSQRLLSLRPVKFRYKADVQKGERPVQFGLIAEEVAQVFPDLVVYNKDGQPETVRYHILSTLLLNELQGVQSRVIELESTRNEKEGRLAALERELQENREQLVALQNERQEKEARLVALEGMVQRLAAPTHLLTGLAPSQ